MNYSGTWRNIVRFAKRFWWPERLRWAAVIALLALAMLSQFPIPILTMYMLDRAVPHRDIHLLFVVGISSLTLYALRSCCLYLSEKMTLVLKERTTLAIQSTLRNMKYKIYGSLLWFGLAACLGGRANAQNLPILNDGNVTNSNLPRNIPKFSVVSVKEHRSDPNSMGMQVTPGGFIGRNLKLRDLICMAYGVRRDQIVGSPSWTTSIGYDIDAKVAEQDVERLKAVPITQRRLMLQSVLTDRFGLKYHMVGKEVKIFELVQAGGSVKPKASSPEMEREIANASADNPGTGTVLSLEQTNCLALD